MWWPLSVLPVLTALLSVGDACPLGHPVGAQNAYPVSDNQTLWRRVRVGGGGGDDGAPTASSLFNMGDGKTPGDCSGQSGVMNDWLKEAILLHDAVETAYDSTKSNKRLMLLWISFFGIEFNTHEGTPDTDDDVFPSQASDSRITAYFIEAFKGYNFEPDTEDSLCGKATLYALTARPQPNPDRTIVEETEIEIGEYDRHIVFCPPSFSPGAGHPHSYPSLSQAVSSDHYPKGDPEDRTSGDMKLDQYLPVSATFYHELYHLADAAGITSDPFYSLTSALNAAKSNGRGETHRNPESFVFFAMAAYMYLNPPQGRDAVLFVGGIPVKASWITPN
ncbi:uncharacterized protein F4812DRAFT_466949 [Daldinia caldariorum]|uniref:uncharacterized protein n=1 Tax=Daldinia caldariorum TaxID=326644 RepID=UPI0020071EF1|nr:uncharacterized protein F4812DRAFT_466949 [Daldinia caldariorum]KAI1464712.1 hypothetical protein F4812DRAFT_466949 [Daldinia caldariorum]